MSYHRYFGYFHLIWKTYFDWTSWIVNFLCKYEKTPQNNLKFHYRKKNPHISISKSKSWERLLILHRQVVGKSKIDGNIAAPIFGVYLVTVATFALIVFWNPYKKARPRLRNICWWGFLRAYLKAVQIHIFVETWNNKLTHNTSLIGVM